MGPHLALILHLLIILIILVGISNTTRNKVLDFRELFVINFKTSIHSGYLTLFLFQPTKHISAIFFGRTYPRRLRLDSKFKFCNCRTCEIGPGSKKFPYGAWEPAKVGWVVDFLLRFCLKIGCIFTFHEMRWYFLAEIEL